MYLRRQREADCSSPIVASDIGSQGIAAPVTTEDTHARSQIGPVRSTPPSFFSQTSGYRPVPLGGVQE
jgi:hypothetical protein